jgi:hypothetical protein
MIRRLVRGASSGGAGRRALTAARDKDAEGSDPPRKVRHLPPADHKETVIDLLARVTHVSVETQAIVAALR